jgi:hypothetical protein
VPRIDDETGNFIGAGEDPTVELLIHALHLKERKNKKDFEERKQGIYRQIPLVDLIHPDYVQDLAEDHQKGSVDILLIIKGEIYAVRVQGDGHYGELKPKKDALQKMWLKKSGVNVIDIWKHECSELFRKDKLTPKSVMEIAQSFQYQTNDIIISKQAQKKALRMVKS